MKARRGDDPRTRHRLIEVATRLFAEHGFRHVTVRTICREARANVAAVNYHFRNKLGLYHEVLETAVVAARESTALAIAAGEGKPAEEKLRAYIKVHTERILAADGASALQQLVHREMSEPTEMMRTLVDRLIRPRFDYLFEVVGELCGRPTTDPEVRLSAVCIHGLVIMFRPNPMGALVGTRLNLRFDPPAVVDHLTTFSLSALSAYARSL